MRTLFFLSLSLLVACKGGKTTDGPIESSGSSIDLGELGDEAGSVSLEEALEVRLADVEGEAQAWPGDIEDIYKQEYFEGNLRDLVDERQLGDVIFVDCAEYPCIGIIQTRAQLDNSELFDDDGSRSGASTNEELQNMYQAFNARFGVGSSLSYWNRNLEFSQLNGVAVYRSDDKTDELKVHTSSRAKAIILAHADAE